MSVGSTRDSLRQDLLVLVSKSTGGMLDSDGRIGADTEFPDTGMTSLSYLELIDSIETKYGVVIDLESDGPSLTSINKFVAYLQRQGV